MGCSVLRASWVEGLAVTIGALINTHRIFFVFFGGGFLTILIVECTPKPYSMFKASMLGCKFGTKGAEASGFGFRGFRF